MNELTKIRKYVGLTNAPQVVILVLEVTTGQNAIEQAKQFSSY